MSDRKRHIIYKKKLNDLGRGIASVRKNLRGEIAKKISGKFQAANIGVEVDPKTGVVTLLMDQNFLFKSSLCKII